MRSRLFAPLHPVITQLEVESFPTLQECNALLATHPPISVHSGKPLCFVAQQQGRLSFEAQYEPRCYLQGEVQTRENNWHDLLNALVWLTFPKAKAAINARHYSSLTDTRDGLTTQRGSKRDMLTLLDESGVVVVYADAKLGSLLRDFQWKELFWQRREQVMAGMGFYLFGHGLYEKAMHPYVGMTGQGLLLEVEQEFLGWPLARQLQHLDVLLADYLAAPEHCRHPGELSPVPLLGVPGWYADNENPTFYDDYGYFRPGRLLSPRK